MPGLKEDFLAATNGCQQFRHCGNERENETDSKVGCAETAKEAPNGIDSLKWEDLCLKKEGGFTGSLFLNYQTPCREFLDGMAGRMKKGCLVSLPEAMERELNGRGLGKRALPDVQFNVPGLSMPDHCPGYYKDGFYGQVLKIHLPGRPPCVRAGPARNGGFLAY